MKRVTVKQWAEVLLSLTQNAKEAEAKKSLASFVALLRARRATHLLPRILREYAAQADAAEGVVRVGTRAARELPAAIVKELEALGSHVIIDHTIDPHAIGGLELRMGDVIIDGTVATRLKKLYEI